MAPIRCVSKTEEQVKDRCQQPKIPHYIKVVGAPARNFPAIAIANSVKDGNGKPLFTGTTQIYEP